MLRIVLSILLLSTASVAWSAAVTQTHTIQSSFLNEERSVLIRLPADYSSAPDRRYPILVTLNETDNFTWVSNIVEIQASRFGIEDMIVVGLPHAGNYTRDNYPFTSANSTEPNQQAENYANFIISEALVFVDENFRTNGGRFIVGHSLSGLFVLNLFMQEPEQFSVFVALSPSLHRAPQLITLLQQNFNEGDVPDGSLYIALGDMEHQLIRQPFVALEEMMKQSVPANLNLQIDMLASTDHMLAAYKGSYDALAWIYKDWYIQDTTMQTMQLQDYISHFDSLAERIGYAIKPREQWLTGFAGFAKSRLSDRRAARVALEAALHFYPESERVKEDLETLRSEQ